MNKTDSDEYRRAVEDFERWRGQIDTEVDANKPHRADYEKAIGLRQSVVDWCHVEGLEILSAEDKAFYDSVVDEIERLRADFSRLNPPKLNDGVHLPIDPIQHSIVGGYGRCIIWLDRIHTLKSYKKWTGTTDHSKTIGGNLDEYLKAKKTDALTGTIKAGSYDLLQHRLNHFRSFCGASSIEQFNAKTLAAFCDTLKQEIIANSISQAYAQGIMTSTKSFVRWLWKAEVLDNLPRNINDLHITVEEQEIILFTRHDIATLLGAASDRTRLYLLLMLNCGYYQQDISDLKHEEVNWEQGRIFRKRSKTAKKATVPKVNYKLWDTTFELLKRFRSGHPTLVLVNDNGSALRQRGFRQDGKTQNLDNIKKAYERVCNKLGVDVRPMKLVRKTGASTLEQHDIFARYAQYYLGQAAVTVADRRYVRPSDEQFDKALKWLGEQFGIQ